MAKFQAGLGPAGLSQPAPSRTCRIRPGRRPAPPGPGRAGSVDSAHLVPTHPLQTWFRQQDPKQGAQRRNSAGRGEENISESLTRAHTRQPVGRRLTAQGRLPQDTWPPRDATAKGTSTGRGKADSKRRAGRGPPPGLSCQPRVQWPLGTRCPLCCDARRGFCSPEQWGGQ